MREIFLPNLEATDQVGRKMGQQLRAGDIVKFTGPLGAGKTTFIRSVVAGIGGDPDLVHSPTFTLVHEYPTEKIKIIHCDFYRLQQDSQLEEFGGLEFFSEDFIYLVEWPEKIGLWNSIIRERLLDVNLRQEQNGRILSFSSTKIILD